MKIRVQQAKALGKTLEIKKNYLEYSLIPAYVFKILIASEDALFYEHFGFDFKAMIKAYKNNEKKGNKRIRGASTITQQLAKNIYLSPDKNYGRKILEGYYSFWMEVFLTKKRILELYINNIEWGEGIFGIDQASKYHFRKSIKTLSKYEICLLIAIIPNPRKYTVHQKYIIKKAQKLLTVH